MNSWPDLQQALDALGSPVRREILWLVRDEELAAGTIASRFELAPPTISEHLAVLVRAGLLSRRVDGSSRRYRARRDVLDELRPLLEDEGHRWEAADDVPERAHAATQRLHAVAVRVDVPRPPEEVFDALTDGERFSAWMGTPTSIDDAGRFACELEWGTQVRGRYELVLRPSLIALRWDFADDEVPVPMGQLVSYLRFDPSAAGTTVTVHQLAGDTGQVGFLALAWSTVLGRLAEGLAKGGERAPRRPPRPKIVGARP